MPRRAGDPELPSDTAVEAVEDLPERHEAESEAQPSGGDGARRADADGERRPRDLVRRQAEAQVHEAQHRPDGPVYRRAKNAIKFMHSSAAATTPSFSLSGTFTSQPRVTRVEYGKKGIFSGPWRLRACTPSVVANTWVTTVISGRLRGGRSGGRPPASAGAPNESQPGGDAGEIPHSAHQGGIDAQRGIDPDQREQEVERAFLRPQLVGEDEERVSDQRGKGPDGEGAWQPDIHSDAEQDQEVLRHQQAPAQILEQERQEEPPAVVVVEPRDLLVHERQGLAARLESTGHTVDHRQRSEEHTSELQSPCNLVCRLLLEKKKIPGRRLS